EIYSSGMRDDKNFIESGSFMFKAEPVDQYGNLIDRHNLWEMVGVRYRRALFPGYSDTVEYLVDCPTTLAPGVERERATAGEEVQQFDIPFEEGVDQYTVVARLMYRKVDQFLINFLLGEDSGLTAPVVEMNRITKTIDLAGAEQQAERDKDANALPAPAGG
ncbi:MAG: hypothetical protein WBO54_18685, partial [Thermoanaerobaculia bacterium]